MKTRFAEPFQVSVNFTQTEAFIPSHLDHLGLSFFAHLGMELGFLGLLEDQDVGVGVFPESKEILVGSLCLGRVSR